MNDALMAKIDEALARLAPIRARIHGPAKPHDVDVLLTECRAALLTAWTPIDMVLHCPACHTQHIDTIDATWENPPHRSHLCANCGFVWRPADVDTNGVPAVKTQGQRDSGCVR